MPTTSFAESLHEKSGGAIPSESATPEEVRMYITELLIDDYFTPPNEAKQHASKWEIGRCSQLFLNTEEAQRRIFGENVGLCIHRALQVRMRALWEKEPSVVYSKYASLICSTLLMTVTIFLALTLDLSKPEHFRILGYFSIFWVLNSICAVFYTIKHPFNQLQGVFVCVGAVFSLMIGFSIGMAAFASS